jgi:hypothetical protein
MIEAGSSRRIEIAWAELGIAVTAELDGRNGALADALWDALPYRSLQGHALVAGHHLFHVAPVHELLYVPPTERIDRREAPDGTVFCSRLQHLGIKYGTLSEPMPATPVGRVREEDLDALVDVGRKVWQSVYASGRPVVAEVRRAGDGGGHRVPLLPARDPQVRALIAEVHAETERIFVDPPAELVEMHEGRIASGAGSYDTVLTTLLFVNGETRPLGYCCFTGMARAAAEEMPLDCLRRMARILASTPAEFLGYCGLNTLHDFTERALDCADRIDRHEDFVALMAHMALYANTLGGWNLQLFPWDLGDVLRRASVPA